MIDAEKNLATAKRRLNMVSDDIRAFEAYLAETGINLPFEMPVGNQGDAIGWKPVTNNRFRLTWSDGVVTKPLIETKVEIRVRAVKELSRFLSEISKFFADMTDPL